MDGFASVGDHLFRHLQSFKLSNSYDADLIDYEFFQ